MTASNQGVSEEDVITFTFALFLNSFVVKAINIQPLAQRKIGAPAARAARALEVAGSNPGVSVTSFLNFYCFRARFARKCERSDPRVYFYSTPSCVTTVNSLNL